MPDQAPAATGDWPQALGHTIKVWRTDLRMSRRQLAQRASISYSYLSAIENGTKEPSTKILRILADRLGVTTQDLLTAAEERLSLGDEERNSLAETDAAIIEAQDRRFARRQEARFGQLTEGTPDLRSTYELVDLLPQLDAADIEALTAIAHRLITKRAKRLRPADE